MPDQVKDNGHELGAYLNGGGTTGKSKTIKSITIGCIVAFIIVIILVLFLNRIVPLKKIIVSEENIKLNNMVVKNKINHDNLLV